MSDELPTLEELIEYGRTVAATAIREASSSTLPQSGPGPCAERTLTDKGFTDDQLRTLLGQVMEDFARGEGHGIGPSLADAIESNAEVVSGLDSDPESVRAVFAKFLTEAIRAAEWAARRLQAGQ